MAWVLHNRFGSLYGTNGGMVYPKLAALYDTHGEDGAPGWLIYRWYRWYRWMQQITGTRNVTHGEASCVCIKEVCLNICVECVCVKCGTVGVHIMWDVFICMRVYIYIYKEDCLYVCLSVSVAVCLNAFAQFSRYRVQTSQERQWITGTGRRGVDDSTIPLEGSEIKG